MTNKMRYSFATGNWGMQRAGAAGARTGVTQPLSRQSHSAALSHSRRVDQQLAREGKIAKPRQLHNTQWGMMCCAETPEGQACGLVKNMTINSTFSIQANNAPGILEILYEFGMRPLIQRQWVENGETEDLKTVVSLENTKVMLDCRWVGTTSEPERLVEFLRNCRRRGHIIKQSTSIVYIREENEIRLCLEAGRVIRPLFIVDQEKRQLLLTKEKLKHMIETSPKTLWKDLLVNGYIEYLDVQEHRNAQIAMYPQDLQQYPNEQFTHCELHPATMLGVSASMIPFPNHNQSPRNMYQSAMGKQAMAIASTNYLQRLDTSAHTLYYPQQPLVQTRFSRNVHFNELPSGEVAIVAILCCPAQNEEDSIVMNQASIDRGLFRSTCYRTYQDREKIDAKPPKKKDVEESKTTTGEEIEYKLPPMNKYEKFCKPEQNDSGYNHRYDHLDEDGLATPGELLGGRDVLIGKTAPMPSKGDESPQRRDCSTLMRANENARVDCVMLTDGPDGARLAKVRTRSVRIPQRGDKFSSTHGQKGTMGAPRREEDMPWTASGIRPDIIINPHAFPSRMTIGQLVETLMGKAAALSGKIGDGTPFNGTSVKDIGDLLHSLGMQRHGGEVMYSGTSGERLDSLVFIGPTFYQRLKHLSADKVHGRAQGPKTALTRQPVEGRGKDGGLRFGEMERDCAVAYGAAEFTMDRLQYCSDNYRAPVCRRCGLIAIDDAQSGQRFCKRCDSHETVEIVDMPYANKLLTQELLSMGIVSRMVLK